MGAETKPVWKVVVGIAHYLTEPFYGERADALSSKGLCSKHMCEALVQFETWFLQGGYFCLNS